MSVIARIRRLFEPDEVLIDGSWIPRESVAAVAGNFIRSSREAQREAKRHWMRAEEAERQRDELQALLTELKRSDEGR